MDLTKIDVPRRYELIGNEPIAKGGCGAVWKARDLLSGGYVALKTVHEVLLMGDSSRRASASLTKQAQAQARLAKLCEDHIVTVVDFGDTLRGVPYLCMEWIEPIQDELTGQAWVDLSSRTGRISLKEAIVVVRSVGKALEVAHRNSVVHSDIAPANIVYDGRVKKYKLNDFGLLKVVDSHLISTGSQSLLVGGRRLFFPDYVRLDPSKISYSTDVYALAVTLLVLLEGEDATLNRNATRVSVPNVVLRRAEGRAQLPRSLTAFLQRFIDNHNQEDTISEFLAKLDAGLDRARE